VFCVLLVAFGSWVFATPLGSAPDEPAHVVKAVSVWQGELRGHPRSVPSLRPGVDVDLDVVRIPRSYLDYAAAGQCSWGKPDLNAACGVRPSTSDRQVEAITPAGSYHPLYYVLVGWPSRVLSGGTGVYAMRLVSASICAGLLTVAYCCLRRRVDQPRAALALVVALTPVAYYLGAIVNPNGVEVAAGIVTWCAALAVFGAWDAKVELDRCSVGGLVVGVGLLANGRVVGVAFAAAIIALALGVAGWRRCRSMLSDRRAWLLAAALAATGVPALIWLVLNPVVVVAIPGFPAGQNEVISLLATIDDWQRQQVSMLGWNDTGPVIVSVAAWSIAGSLLLATVLMFARTSRIVVMGVAIGVALLLPVALLIPTMDQIGPMWMGRYGLAFNAGLPVMAVLVTRGNLTWARVRPLALTCAAICAVGIGAAQFSWLHRNAVGALGPLPLWEWHGWSPPIPAAVLLLTSLVAPVAALWVGVADRPASGPITAMESPDGDRQGVASP